MLKAIAESLRTNAVESLRLLRDRDERRVLFRVFLLFLPMAMAGTLLHEGGHIAVAQTFGHDTELHYGSMSWQATGTSAFTPAELERHSAWISLGGPAQTILTGSLGLLWLAWLATRRPKRPRLRWLATLLALFWSRELFNFGGNIATWLVHGRLGGDEVELAIALGLPAATLAAPLGLIGFAACCWVVRLQPSNRRLHLLLAGPAGCVTGFVVWYLGVGPLLLPGPA